MLRKGVKLFLILSAVFTLNRCIDPYTPVLKGYESVLVVEGLITDENSSYIFKLSRTLLEQTDTPVVVSDATVYITDEESNTINLENIGNGKYKTDSLEFRGAVGKTYILHILTNDGSLYESEPYTMLSVPEIEDIYFEKDQELVNNGTENSQGIRIYLDTKGSDNTKYYRWDFDEAWKFKVPVPKKFDYLNDTTILPVDIVKAYCYRFQKSKEILIYSAFEGLTVDVKKQPVLFIDPTKSDRLQLHYSINIKQYSVSKKEYEFWYNMKQINEKGGNIYSLQPFPVVSNVHNVNNQNEQVLGYFQVSAVKQKRKFIPFSDVVGFNLQFYRYPCKRIEMAPKDYPRSVWLPPLTFDELYDMYCKTGGYYFIEPKYVPGTNELEKLVFSSPECADCELTGTIIKPDFWVDIN
jgi:hypothetical protein